MFDPIDQSPALSRRLQRLSAGLAKQRGLPIVIGVVLIIVSFIVSLINLGALSPVLDAIWTITHHLGLIIALIGILLVEPLG